MGGFAEEYYYVGLHYAKNGSLGLSANYPWSYVHRPPGYSFFIGVVLKTWSKFTTRENATQITNNSEVFAYKPGLKPNTLQDSFKAVYFAQALVLALSAVFLFLLLSHNATLSSSFVMALLFGCNPYMIIHVGLLHYSILHIFLIIISTYSLVLITGENRPDIWKFIFPGILWGLATLTRPTTLLLPIFIFILFCILFSYSKRMIVKSSLVFILGMIMVIMPYTIRNYSLTERFIPINVQGGMALWAGTNVKLDNSPNHYRFWNVWYEHGVPVYNKFVAQYNAAPYTGDYNAALPAADKLDRVFRDEAIHNIVTNPSIYFHNVLSNFVTFNIDINSVMIKLFQAMQGTYTYIDKSWFAVGTPQIFYYSTLENVFLFYIYALTLFSFTAILLFVKKVVSRNSVSALSNQDGITILKEPSERGIARADEISGVDGASKEYIEQPGLSRSFWADNSFILCSIIIYSTLCIAHSITYMDLMYYYQKVPFLFLFTGYFLDGMNKYTVTAPIINRPLSASVILKAVLLLYGLTTTFLIIF